MIRPFAEHTPNLSDNAYIDDTALLIGQVTLGENSSIWPMSVLRGDVQAITIGENTNIQDSCVLHVTHASSRTTPNGIPLIIGNNITVGHKALLHACTIHDNCLIGMGSIVMDNATIHSNTIIGAGSLVPPNKTLESSYLWVGNPVKKVRELTKKELEYIKYSADNYVSLAQKTYKY
ncbi:MAG: carbonic anhydrase, family 3 [uncultured Thiotrichaceae bacterium]|uniref:Carbonic anhydrase, family 3 n=1 Tax=uncultured Thiotrichaceae bacterium TaxID=298394 RepID=A0A6S6UAT6_9GAMM|nr:MAG: carbonic anhydrase, family 3 [uncultured Thiotrichaceae bacterium]